jgi:hypothetical protein
VVSEELLKKQLAEAMRANADLKRRLQEVRLEAAKLRAEINSMRTEMQMGD